jgi:HlyD family secretion protein
MKKSSIIGLIAVAAVIVGVLIYRHSTKVEAPPYRFTPVERGDLEAAVSATGTLSAVTTVQVGTQVSGRIVAMYADFNDPVKKGQLVARIDPVLQEQTVRDAQAGLERNRAQMEQAKVEYERNRGLFERKVLTEVEFNSAKYAYEIAQANVKSAQVALDRAKQNLAYTQIYAPVDGVIVERTVDVGQTVAASLSAPQLFLIANDLSQMQILASVDESDIGSIKPGQPVRFTVQAYPNESFNGTVKKVRLQSKTTENVVNYTVEVSVANPSGKLLPGMTATVEFVTGSAKDVLMIANSALRFRPTEQMIAQMREKRAKNGGAREAGMGPGGPEGSAAGGANGSAQGGGAGGGQGSFAGRGANGGEAGGAAGGASRGGANGGEVGGAAGGGSRSGANGGEVGGAAGDTGRGGANGGETGGAAGSAGRGANGGPGGFASGAGQGGFGGFGGGAGRPNRRLNSAMLWYLDDKGELAVERVRTGITDGTRTQITGRNVKDGQQIIVGVTQTEAAKSTNPFQPQAPAGGMRRPAGPGM